VTAELRELPYSGWTVTRICVDFAFQFGLEPEDPHGDLAWVSFGSPFEYRAPDGSSYDMQPGPPQASVAPALAVHNQRILSITASSEGHLNIALENGSALSIGPDENYEAWEIRGPVSLLSGPGGGKPWAG
jgi:Family of unknown function (DUF6188)